MWIESGRGTLPDGRIPWREWVPLSHRGFVFLIKGAATGQPGAGEASALMLPETAAGPGAEATPNAVTDCI